MWPTADQPLFSESAKIWKPSIDEKNLQEVLTKNATLSLKQWAFYLNLNFNDRSWTVYRVRQWFRLMSIKRKKVVIHKPFRRVETTKTIA